jgi:Fe-S oxidoreductase
MSKKAPKTILDEHKAGYACCTYCPKLCRHTCPVGNAEARESVITQSKMMMGDLMRRRVVQCRADYASVYYHCAGCGHCTEFCLHDVPVTPALFAARAAAVAKGAAPPSMQSYPEVFYRRNDDLVHRLHRLVDEHYFVEEAQVAYMPGCDLIEYCPEDVRHTLTVLEAAGVDYVALMEGDLVCGGYPLWAAGHPAEFRHVATEQARRLAGYKKVVCACPSCVYAMRALYPAMGVEVAAEVLHVTEFLDTFAHRIPVKKSFPAAFYHDPCYLGRFLGIYDPPRRLASLALEQVIEFSWNRESSYCCGAGGLLPVTVPEAAAHIAHDRLEEVYHSEISMVITACASCVHNLQKNAPALEVLDVMALLARAL